ncbi:MAG: YdcF family protein [Anaerolineales bacterium]|nr:YdcF family protein [Anaerolineales bacterium]
MFIFLSKLIPPLVYPLGFSCLLIIAGLIFFKKIRFQRMLLVIALGLLILSSNRWVSWGLLKSLEWRYLPPTEIPHEEVIVVLGGGTYSPLYPRQMVEMSGAGDRVTYAYWLFKQGKADHLLLTGGSIDWLSSDENPATDMANLLKMLGVPEDAIWLEPESRNTYEDAAYSAKILKEKGISRIILVTSAFHMPRSVKLFEKQGLQVIPAPVDFVVTQKGWENITTKNIASQLNYLLPGAENLSNTTKALKEYLGILVYSINGWL